MRFVYNSRLAGNELSHLDLRSGSLSWSEHRALLDTATATAAAAQEAAHTRYAIQELRYEVTGVANAVDRMERSLALRLDAQAGLLRTEIELLANIAESLRTPRATSAAERITDAGTLLDDGRFERALSAAQEAIEDDPNNQRGFVAAGWALLGLERADEARSQFREAAQCGRGDGAHSGLRQAARLTFLLDGAEAALRELGEGSGMQVSAQESAAADFDRVVYNAAIGNSDEAIERLRAATADARGFSLMALVDPVASSDKRVVDTAVALLKELDALRLRVDENYDPVARRLKSVLETLKKYEESDNYCTAAAEIVDVAADTLDRFRTVETEPWGTTAMHLALDEAANDSSSAHTTASRFESYIQDQRDVLQCLRSHLNGRVPLYSPAKIDGVWQVIVASRDRRPFSAVYARRLFAGVPPARPESVHVPLEELTGSRNQYSDEGAYNSNYAPLRASIATRKRAPLPWAYLDY